MKQILPKVKISRQGKRAILAALIVPPLLVGIFGMSLAYRIYAANRAIAQAGRFPIMALPQKPQSILVFAPHSDDEVLGAGGLMRQAGHAGIPVHVVVLTNGDGFRVSVEREYHKLGATPADFVNYGYLRQTETEAALTRLGLPQPNVVFLGYPDRGLMPMWTDHWSAQTPFRSYYTRADHSPYDNGASLHAPYCGAALLSDIIGQMQADKPTDIYVTHPSDDHPDHSAAGIFVKTALDQLRTAGVPWALHAHLHYYIVHRGDWPVPQGLHEDAPLPPPAPMAGLDTQWTELPLSHRDTQAKYAAIKRYRTQIEIESRFLYSFARENELFGTLTEPDQGQLPRVPDGQIRMTADRKDWAKLTPIEIDPAEDSILRDFQGGADLTRLFACRDSSHLYVRLDTVRTLSTRVTYTLTLRPLKLTSPQPSALTISIVPDHEGIVQSIPSLPGGSYVWKGATLVAMVPLADASLTNPVPGQTLSVAAQSRLSNLTIDSTGFRQLACGPQVQHTAALPVGH